MIPTEGYFDDLGLAAPIPLAGGAYLAPTELTKIFGFEFTLSKSEGGQILEFLRLVIDLPAFPAIPPLLYLPDLDKCKLEARIAEILDSGRVSPAALKKLVGKPSPAQPSILGEIVRAMLRPSRLQSSPDVA